MSSQTLASPGHSHTPATAALDPGKRASMVVPSDKADAKETGTSPGALSSSPGTMGPAGGTINAKNVASPGELVGFVGERGTG